MIFFAVVKSHSCRILIHDAKTVTFTESNHSLPQQILNKTVPAKFPDFKNRAPKHGANIFTDACKQNLAGNSLLTL